jgi:hypothetical protein
MNIHRGATTVSITTLGIKLKNEKLSKTALGN